MAAPVLQLRVPEDTLTRIDQARGDATRSAWVQRLIDRELTGQTASSGTEEAVPAPAATAPSLTLPPGEPCPGVACSGPGCWNRDTARYGLRHLVLCTACAAALQDQIYKREVPGSAAKLIRRGAA